MSTRNVVAVMCVVGAGGVALAQVPQDRTLVPGAVVVQEVRGGAAHDYRIEARAGDAIDIRVTQLGVDVVVSVLDPAGTLLAEIDSPTGAQGDEEALLIAAAPGAYRVQIRPFEVTGAGTFELRAAVRAATARDRALVEVGETLTAAPRLFRTGVEADAATAVKRLQQAWSLARDHGSAALARTVGSRLLEADAAAAFAELKVQSAPGAVPVYYSEGLAARATTLRDALARAVDLFDARLKVRPRVALAMLARDDWERVAGVPYGMPFSNPGRSPLIVIPGEQVMFAAFGATLQKDPTASVAAARVVAETGLSFDEGIQRYADTVIYHELGHQVAFQYGIVQPNRWFAEFLAAYFGQAYLAEVAIDPKTLAFSRVFNDWLRNQSVTHRSLDDLERLYTGVGDANYGWYQGQFEARAVLVYQTQGWAFATRVKAAFPETTPPTLPLADVLARLETIMPGFVAWGRDLSTPARP